VQIVRGYTRSTIAKRQVEELAVRGAQDFDAFYEERATKRDPQNDLLVINTDGKGSPCVMKTCAKRRVSRPRRTLASWRRV